MGSSSPDYGWTVAPGPLLALTAMLAIYVVRWRRVRAQAGARAAGVPRLVAFLSGVLALFVALVSPVDRLAEQLATMHMVQHLLLVDIAPILLLTGLTKAILRPVSRTLVRVERRAGLLGHPAFGVIAYTAGMAIYHVPAVYDLTLESSLAHALAHVMLAVVGGIYWWHLLSPTRQRLRMGRFGPVVYMASTKLFVGAIAIALGFSQVLLYDAYAGTPEYWGMSKLTDQNVAGVFMALEQSIVMGIAVGIFFIRALADSERDDQRAERLHTT